VGRGGEGRKAKVLTAFGWAVPVDAAMSGVLLGLKRTIINGATSTRVMPLLPTGPTVSGDGASPRLSAITSSCI
jgi:hypothetical protein